MANAKLSKVKAPVGGSAVTYDVIPMGLHYVAGTGTAAVTTSPYTYSKWEASCSAITELYDGLTLTYKVPVAGNGSYGTCLQVNNLGYHPVVSTVSTHISTRYGVNATLLLVYNSSISQKVYSNSATSATVSGCWVAVNDYDSGNSNTYDRTYHNSQIKCATAVSTTWSICVGDSAGYKPAASGATFDISYPIVTNGVGWAAGSSYTNGYVLGPAVNLANTKSSWTVTAGAMAYLVGTLSGKTFTIDSTVFTTTVPTSEDGKVYIPIGKLAQNSTNTVWFYPERVMYRYLGNSFSEINAKDVVSISRSGTTFTATRADGSTFTFSQQDSNSGGTVTKVTAGTGLSIGTTAGGNFTTTGTINHTNAVTAQTTQAIYPIKIDAQGHISAYGTAVTPLTTIGATASGSGYVSAVTANGSTITVTKTAFPTASTTNAGIIQIGTGAANAAAGNHSHSNYLTGIGASSSGDGFVSTVTANGSTVTVTKTALPTASTTTAGIIKIGTGASDAAAGNHSHSGYLTGHQTIKQDGVTGASGNHFASCTIAASTTAKTAAITSGTYALETGSRVIVNFTNKNTANSPTLNIGGTGAKNIFHNGAQITTGTNKGMLYGAVEFVYDGTQYQLVGNYVDTNNTNVSATATTGAFVTSVTANGSLISVTKGDLPTASSTTAGITKVGASGGAAAYSHTHSYLSSISSTSTGSGFVSDVSAANGLVTVTKSSTVTSLTVEDITVNDAINHLLTGTGTAAVTTSPFKPALWKFNTGRTVANGDIYHIKIPVAGHNYGVFMSVDNGTNYYPVVLNGTGRVTTHYPVNTTLEVLYESASTAVSMTPVAGATTANQATITNGVFRVLNYYDSNTNYYPVYINTASTTAAKVGSNSQYWNANTLSGHSGTGSLIPITLQNANTVQGALTLNISSTGAKPIYINGTASGSSNYTLPAGSYIVYYNGTNYYFDTTGRVPNHVTTTGGTNGYLAKFTGSGTIANGPQLGSGTTTYLRNDGSWATPSATIAWGTF